MITNFHYIPNNYFALPEFVSDIDKSLFRQMYKGKFEFQFFTQHMMNVETHKMYRKCKAYNIRVIFHKYVKTPKGIKEI